MNNLSKFFLAFLLIANLAACKKDDDGGTGSDAAEGSVKAKIAGTNWSSTTASAMYVSTGKMLSIMGVDGGGKTINLMVNGYDEKTGTYEIGSSGIANTASYIEASVNGAKTWAAPYTSSGAVGKVQISEFSKTGNVKGTFNFKARNQNDNADFREVTEGSFNLKVTSR